MKPTDVRTARKRRGWDQKTLAGKAGVDQSVISRIERGETTNPTSETVMRLAKALRIDPRSLEFGQREAQAS